MGDMVELPDVEIKVVILTGFVITLDVNPRDTVLDLRQILGEAMESCYVTSYHVYDKNDEMLEDYDTLGDIAKGDEYTLKFKNYNDKEMRLHVNHLQGLLAARLDEVMVSPMPTTQHSKALEPQKTKSYPSFAKLIGNDVQKIASDLDDTYPEPKSSSHPELPDAGPFACAEDFTKPVTLDGFYEMMQQIPSVKHAISQSLSITWSGFNPPQRHRRLQGDLGYIDLQFQGGALYQVTCTPHGFFVNQTKTRSELNPAPAAKPHHSETLLGLIFQLNPKYKEKTCELFRVRASLHPFETGPIAVPMHRSEWIEPQDIQKLGDIPSGGRPIVQDYHVPVRTWNDEVQRGLELPNGTFEERFVKDKTLSRLHAEFVDFAAQAAVSAVDGHVTPLNPQEPPEQWVYLINNTFISQAVDTRQTYTEIGGNRAARVFAKQDMHGLHAIRKLNTKLSTVSTAIFDYKGKRMVCQTLVPGILMQKADGKVASPQVHGLGEENEGAYLIDEVVQDELKKLAPALHLESHMMKDAEGEEHVVHANSEIKAMHSSDDRRYLLECSKLTPRDVNWPDNYLAFTRFELIEDFIRSKRTHPVYAEINAEMLKRGSTGESSVDGHFWAMEKNAEADIEHVPKFNCDMHTFMPNMQLTDPKEKQEASQEVLKELAAFLKSKLATIVDEIVKTEVVDTECLKDVFHDYGVNMRYLGEVITMLPDWATNAASLCRTEIVSRILKHKIRDVMLENSLEDVATPVAELLSSVLGDKKKKSEPGKKKKKNKKKKTTPAAKDREEKWIEDAALKSFKHKLEEGWISTIDKFMLLRAVCCKTGITVKQRRYDFTEDEPIEAEDIIDMWPIMHHHPPYFSAMEALLDNSQQEGPEITIQKVRQALTHAHIVVGAVCTESALCFQALAKMMLSDIDTAIQHQYKALIISRRLLGPTHGNMVSLLKNISVMAYMTGRYYPAIQYLRRAMYLSRALCGDVSFDILFTLASFYNESGHAEQAIHILNHTVEKATKISADSDQLALCTQHLSLVYGHSGYLTKAVEHQKKALELFNKALGPDNAQTKEADSWYRHWVKTAVEKAKTAKAIAANKAAAPAKKK
eukprot:TRINITY_DN570_c0_g1_i2.p1 TRINITY_DN570_c0_g1~~TRINITY_DN570_c0_g1_i2.p1  ORF type:complete len:1111 (+),score=282.63 TRINITY_DN570_c0_g1_i2:55-3333(+)